MRDEEQSRADLLAELGDLRRQLATASSASGADPAIDEVARSFEALADHANAGIIITDQNAQHVYVNPHFARMTGYSQAELLRRGMRDMIAPEHYAWARAHYDAVLRRTAPGRVELTLVRSDGRRLPVEVAGGVTRWHGRLAVVSMLRDLSARARASEVIHRRLEMERTVAVISSRLVSDMDLDEAITASLADLGRLSGAARTHVFLLSEGRRTLTNTHEWCASGIRSQRDLLGPLPTEQFAWTIAQLRRHGRLRIHDADRLPPDASVERESMQRRGFKAVLALPLYLDGRLAGLMGYSYTATVDRWDDEDLTMLRTVAEMIGAALGRRRAERALAESEQRYRTFVQTTDQGISMMDRHGVFRFVNRVAARKLNAPPEALIGKSMWDLFPRPMADSQFAVVQRVLDTGQEQHVEAWSEIQGQRRYYRVGVYPLYDHAGHAHQVMIMTTDLTDQKRTAEALQEARDEQESRVAQRTAELTAANADLRREIAEHVRTQQALAQSERRYRLLAENVTDVIWTTDMDMRATYASPSVVRLRGYTAAETIGQRLEDLLPPSSVGIARRTVAEQRALEADPNADPERSWTVELELTRKDGSAVWAELTSTFLRGPDGQPIGLLGVARDITERRRLERALLQISSREQERIGQDLHDGLCQLLRGTALMTEALKEELEPADRPTADRVEQIVVHLRQAVTEARSMARGLNPVGLDANGLTDALEDLARSMQSFYGVACRFACPEAAPTVDTESARHLYRIAQEAVHNAIRHGRPSRVDIQLEAGPDGIALTVRDDGCGCPSDPPTGKGMGLRIMHYRARMIGASLRLRSQPGQGTRVTCVLPIPLSNGS